MPNAARILGIAIGTAAIVACHNAQPPVQDNHDMSPESNLAAGELPSNAEIETLPADESSTTPSNQLQNGYDNPDVNDVGNSH